MRDNRIEKILGEMCDQYCKWPFEPVPEGKEDGWLFEDGSPCDKCPLAELQEIHKKVLYSDAVSRKDLLQKMRFGIIDGKITGFVVAKDIVNAGNVEPCVGIANIEFDKEKLREIVNELIEERREQDG